MFDAKKINILEGDWSNSYCKEKVISQIQESKIPIFKHETIPLTQLYNDSYWSSTLKNNDIHFASIDSHHWHYSDSVFNEYLQRFSSVNFSVVCIESNPLDVVKPNIDIDAFYAKLFERTELISSIIRKNHPNTIILSPPISILDNDHYDRCLDYIIHNRQHFDIYSVHCVNDMSEHSLGRMSSLLNQAMKILPKEVWVTRWSVPGFEGIMSSEKMMGESDWEPVNYKVAAQRLRRSFSFVESAATSGSKWFYSGFSKDIYQTRNFPGPHEFWHSASLLTRRTDYSANWDSSHFVGLMNSKGDTKYPVLKSLINLAAQHNA